MISLAVESSHCWTVGLHSVKHKNEEPRNRLGEAASRAAVADEGEGAAAQRTRANEGVLRGSWRVEEIARLLCENVGDSMGADPRQDRQLLGEEMKLLDDTLDV
ncbi:hypothetical protein Syun_007344 [Stephania yunnanensis]|uniref:Uncharacterized protein n=1 Tax=Stephania yunnanensis TaxID=152371 RepID=A0AAP0PYL7_9MAGN